VPLNIAMMIAFACRKERLRYALGFAMVKKESNYQHIFGHDAGGLYPGEPVTRARYRRLRQRLKETGGSGANGVGFTQVTYWTYIVNKPGLWKKRPNIYFGINLFADYVRRLGERTGAGAYNGGEGNPQYSYADALLKMAREIRPHLK
jgi:hypothetical protein